MKIAIVSDAVYPYHKGGKERRFYEISTRLAKKGHDVHIYCMKWWKSPEKMRYENGVYLHAISPYYPLYGKKRRNIKQGIIFGLFCLNLFKEDWDVIEVDHMPYFPLFFTKIVCLLKGKKMYATWNEVWGLTYWLKYMGKAGYISALIEKISVHLPDLFISISHHTTERLKEVYKLPAKKIVTVSTGLDTEAIENAPVSTEKSDVLYSGRLLKHKNVAILLDAIKILTKKRKNIVCAIIGNGPEKKRLIRQAHDLEIEKNITFIDFLPHHEDLFSFMKASKIFVLPSTREGFGMAVLEANASGIPAIVTNHPDNAAQDLIEKHNGKVIHLNSETLAQTIDEMLKNLPDPAHVKRTPQKYSWDKIVKKLEEVYKS